MNSTLISSCLYLQQFTAPEHPLDTPFHPSGQIPVASIIAEGDCLVNPPFLKHFSTNFNPFPSRPTPSLSRFFFSLRRKKSSFRSGVRRDTMIRWPWNSDDGGSLASRPPSGEGAQSHNGITRHDPPPPPHESLALPKSAGGPSGKVNVAVSLCLPFTSAWWDGLLNRVLPRPPGPITRARGNAPRISIKSSLPECCLLPWQLELPAPIHP